jgi:hypothetical protein
MSRYTPNLAAKPRNRKRKFNGYPESPGHVVAEEPFETARVIVTKLSRLWF